MRVVLLFFSLCGVQHLTVIPGAGKIPASLPRLMEKILFYGDSKEPSDPCCCCCPAKKEEEESRCVLKLPQGI
jgi:hypothetical protein